MVKKKHTSNQDIQEQLVVFENKWKRALADYQNLEKRIATQQANFVKFASVGLIEKLLPVMDDLKRAAVHVHDVGIDMIVKQFEEVLSTEGVKKIEVEGRVFDPAIMDCVEMTPGEANVVTKVVQEGYMIDSTVIRPAKVEVGVGNDTEPKPTSKQK